MAKKPLIYISGALTAQDPEHGKLLRAMYERVAEVCGELGFEPYLPHKISDPILHQDLTPEQVDDIDRAAVCSSILVIAFGDVPAIGVGIEIEMAKHAGKPVILVYSHKLFEKKLISRLARANVINVAYHDFYKDGLAQIGKEIAAVIKKMKRLPRPLQAF